VPEETGVLPGGESPNEDGGVAEARLRVPPWAPEVTFHNEHPDQPAEPESPSETTAPWAWQHGSGTTRSRMGSRTARLGRLGEVRYVGFIMIGACLFATAGGLAVLSIVGHSQPRATPGATYVPGADGLSQPQIAIAATAATTTTRPSATGKPTPSATHTVTVLRSVGSAASANPIPAPTTPNHLASAVASSAAAQAAAPSTSAAVATTAAAVAETGTYVGYDSLCLDDWARRTVDGNAITIYTCNDTSAQSWTVEPDGTMQVVGMCMDVPDADQVELESCDGAATQVWRSGPDDTLVNASLKLCLDDPDSDAGPGTELDVASCTDGANQQWIFNDD